MSLKLSEATLLADILQATADMREAQRQFFSLKPGDPARKPVLHRSIAAEGRVDALLPTAMETAARLRKESLDDR